MENTIKTYGSHQTPVIATNRANRDIVSMNRDGWRAIQITNYSREMTYRNTLRTIHFVSVLFEKDN